MSFKKLNSEDFVFDFESVAAPMWSNYSSSLTSFYSSSAQQTSISGKYSIDVFNIDPTTTSSAQIQFSIAYGDSQGSGSKWYNPTTPSQSPSRTVYRQFANLLLGEDEKQQLIDFGGGNGETIGLFYAIVIDRAHYKQAIMPGSFQIRGLAAPNVYITDNSRITSTVEYTPAGRRYTLGSGSFGDGITPSDVIAGNRGVYGYLYPDVGIILLNPFAAFYPPLWIQIPFGPPLINSIWKRSFNENDNNPERLRKQLQLTGEFDLQSQETIPSNYIFCRAQNHEFNFSTKPNFLASTRYSTSSLNEVIETPPTYITSVGLYNDTNDLIAVAKLSKPLKKDFTSEALIRVKLDF